MILTLPDALSLAAACAPAVAPETLLSIVKVESGFNSLAIGVNGRARRTVKATSPQDAAAKASALIAAGESIDLGLAQINSRNLRPLRLSVADAFDPCRNLAASAQLLTADFGRSGAQTHGAQTALRTTLSYYNTGDPTRGHRNGYVGKVAAAAAHIVPALQSLKAPLASEPAAPSPPQAQAATPVADWDVFGRAAPATFVIRISAPGDRP